MGNTGAEIALDLCEHGAETTISIRDGVHIVPRDLFGLPIQVVATVATRLLPLKINDALFPVILDFVSRGTCPNTESGGPVRVSWSKL